MPNERNSHHQIAALFRVRPPRRAAATERTYTEREAALLAEAKAEFQAHEARQRDKTLGGKKRGPSIKVESSRRRKA